MPDSNSSKQENGDFLHGPHGDTIWHWFYPMTFSGPPNIFFVASSRQRGADFMWAVLLDEMQTRYGHLL